MIQRTHNIQRKYFKDVKIDKRNLYKRRSDSVLLKIRKRTRNDQKI